MLNKFIAIFVLNLPRIKGIAGFYFVNLVLGLFFLIPSIKESTIAVTIIMGFIRIFGSNFLFIFYS